MRMVRNMVAVSAQKPILTVLNLYSLDEMGCPESINPTPGQHVPSQEKQDTDSSDETPSISQAREADVPHRPEATNDFVSLNRISPGDLSTIRSQMAALEQAVAMLREQQETHVYPMSSEPLPPYVVPQERL